MADTERQLITNSRAKAGRACLRLEQIEFRLRYRPIVEADALRFGTLIHMALEAWWFCRFPRATLATRAYSATKRLEVLAVMLLFVDGVLIADPREQALAMALAIIEMVPGYTPAEQVLAQEMIRGYDARWRDEPYTTVAVEIQFRAPMINPLTGRRSETWDIGGKLDLIIQDDRTGALLFGEHKTAGVDIGVGATYWKRLRMDSQVSTYYDGAEALGFVVDGCLYDVLYKPRFAPHKATPEEERETTLAKYKACPVCKKKGGDASAPHTVPIDDDGHTVQCGATCYATLPDGRQVEAPGEAGKVVTETPRYKATVRWRDETLAEYRERVQAAIAAEPLRYYVREPVPRLEAELAEYRIDLWQLGRLLREQELAGRFPRNPGACERWGRFCDYFDVCTKAASLDDPTRFKRIEYEHAELAPTAEEF